MKILRKCFSAAGKAKLAERAAKKASKRAVEFAKGANWTDKALIAGVKKELLVPNKLTNTGLVNGMIKTGREINKDIYGIMSPSGKRGLHEHINYKNVCREQGSRPNKKYPFLDDVYNDIKRWGRDKKQ